MLCRRTCAAKRIAYLFCTPPSCFVSVPLGCLPSSLRCRCCGLLLVLYIDILASLRGCGEGDAAGCGVWSCQRLAAVEVLQLTDADGRVGSAICNLSRGEEVSMRGWEIV